MDLDLEQHVRSSHSLQSNTNNAQAHFQSTTVSLSHLTQWKEQQLLSDTEFQATSSILQKVLRIKGESLLQATATPKPNLKRRKRSLATSYQWNERGHDQRKLQPKVSPCCGVCPAKAPMDYSTVITKFFYGFGPSIPAPMGTRWKNTRGMMKGNNNFIYKLIVGLGKATGGILASYGIAVFLLLISIITGIYSEYECIEALRTYSANGTHVPFVPRASEQQHIVQRLSSIVLVSISQLCGGGTAPGTVHSGNLVCNLTSIGISILNIGIRSLLFAVGLSLLMEVEPEMIFSSKLCIAMRNGKPTLLCRFSLAGSDCAVVEHISGNVVTFFSTLEGENMSQANKIEFSCFPFCSSPIVGSHGIDRNSALSSFIDILPDGTCRKNDTWNDTSMVNIQVVCYDRVSDRVVRRSRVYTFADVLIGHKFADIMECGIFTAALKLQPPINHMSKMHDTVVQDVFSRSWTKEERERGREKDGQEKDGKEKEEQGNHRNEEQNNKEQHNKDDTNISNSIDTTNIQTDFINFNTTEIQNSTKVVLNSETEATASAFQGRTTHSYSATVDNAIADTLNPNVITLKELNLWRFKHETLTEFEHMFIVGILTKCLHSENGGKRDEQDENRFLKYIRTTFAKEVKEAQLNYEKWQVEYHAYLKACHCQRSLALCWSGRCCNDRTTMDLADVATSIINGQFPEFQMHVKNLNSNLEFDPLYKIIRCIHLGDLRIIALAFVLLVVCLAFLIAAGYTGAQCFVHVGGGSGGSGGSGGANNTNITSIDTISTAPNFGAAASSTFIQLATGAPSDPLRHDHPLCALLILIAAVSNIVIRVLIFSVFLHALEGAKPSIVFSKKLVLKIRNGEPVFQLRLAAPTSPTLQVVNCDMYTTMVVKTAEGEQFGRVTKLPVTCPNNLFVPSFITHALNKNSSLKNHWVQHGNIPKGFLVVKIGLYDPLTSQYFSAVHLFNLRASVYLFQTFKDTVNVGLRGAYKNLTNGTGSSVHVQVDCENFEQVQPQIILKRGPTKQSSDGAETKVIIQEKTASLNIERGVAAGKA